MMKKIPITECLHSLERLGRTFVDQEASVLYCNWTCSGIRFEFEGTSLAVRMKAIPSVENEQIFHPWMAVVLDDGDEISQRIELAHPDGLYTLFQSDKSERHIISLVKLTENNKGKVGLSGFWTDGEIHLPAPQEDRLKIEFIGDSITCGFGNMVNSAAHPFYSQDENGWMAHAAVAARKLNADSSIISCSGIAATEGISTAFPQMLLPMGAYYPYQDRFWEEANGKKEDFTPRNFEQFKPDVIVINLGTNDAAMISLNRNESQGIRKFEEDYQALLALIRKCNGPEPHIICALGSIDYFLYDSICRAANAFAAANHDQRISCFKYNRVRPDEGLGACGHPNVTTQIRMGQEIADYITSLMSKS